MLGRPDSQPRTPFFDREPDLQSLDFFARHIRPHPLISQPHLNRPSCLADLDVEPFGVCSAAVAFVAFVELA